MWHAVTVAICVVKNIDSGRPTIRLTALADDDRVGAPNRGAAAANQLDDRQRGAGGDDVLVVEQQAHV
jgi:hypothetical protein